METNILILNKKIFKWGNPLDLKVFNFSFRIPTFSLKQGKDTYLNTNIRDFYFIGAQAPTYFSFYKDKESFEIYFMFLGFGFVSGYSCHLNETIRG